MYRAMEPEEAESVLRGAVRADKANEQRRLLRCRQSKPADDVTWNSNIE